MVEIRRARPDDLPQIAALHVANWRADYRGVLSDAALGDPLHAMMTAKWAADAIEGVEIAVAEVNGTVLGFAAWQPEHPDGPYLDNFHTAAKARGQGLGRALIATLIADLRARGKRDLWLIVFSANTATRALYRHWGAEEGPEFPDDILGETVPARRVRWADVTELEQAVMPRAT